LHQLLTLSETIQSSKTDFDTAKLALEKWRDLGFGGERWEGVREWQELVDLELAGFGVEEEEIPITGRKKGRR
jgi:hypothetical protein